MRRREHDSEVVLGTAEFWKSLCRPCFSVLSIFIYSVSTRFEYILHIYISALFIFCIGSIKHFARRVYNISHSDISSAATLAPNLLLSVVRQKMAESAELVHGIDVMAFLG